MISSHNPSIQDVFLEQLVRNQRCLLYDTFIKKFIGAIVIVNA
jgi:hypothetical protein